MTAHYEERLLRNRKVIEGKLMHMSAMVQAAVRNSVDALVARDRQSAYSVILRDQRIDALEKEIDRLCLEFLVKQQPPRNHLAFAYATIRINLELERIGDYAESIARQVLKLSSLEPQPSYDKFVAIANLSVPMLQQAVEAFLQQNTQLASSTMGVEEEVDALRDGINAALLQQAQHGKIPVEALSPLMTIARRLDRLSGRARHICEQVLDMRDGGYAQDKAREVVRILFIDKTNSCVSQMAQAIASSLRRPEFLFSSGGLEPRPVDPATTVFLAGARFDISRLTSKSVGQIPNLDHYQILVFLAKDARKLFASIPARTVAFDWIVDDPSTVVGSAREIRTAYERTFQYLDTHVRDLVAAMLDDKNRLNGPPKNSSPNR